MRWWALVIGMLAGMLMVVGCSDPAAQPPVTISLLTFLYDPQRQVALAVTRDVVISPAGDFITSMPVNMATASPTMTPTQPYSTNHPSGTMDYRIERQDYGVVAPARAPYFIPPVGAQEYANALANLPQMNLMPAPGVSFANPVPTVTDGALSVNYLTLAGLDQLSVEQASPIFVSLESWWWVPGVHCLTLLINGNPLKVLGPYTFCTPLQRSLYTFLVQGDTGEVGYQIDAPYPANLADALDILAKRELALTPATQGFIPLIPPDVNFTAYVGNITNGVLTFDLSTCFDTKDQYRLAGLVLMLTQFPEVSAVQFAFNGQIVDAPFMRANLNQPLTATDLILPTTVGMLPCVAELNAIQNTVQASLGHSPASMDNALVWQQWASVQVVPTQGATSLLYVMRKVGDHYAVFASGTDLKAEQLLRQGMPHEAIIALHLQLKN